MKNTYYGSFENKESLEKEFNTKLDKNINIIYAEYNNEDYSGNAVVIFEQDNKIYEVHASHCSCYGLEGQFSPEESSFESILERAKNKTIPYTDCSLIIKTINEFNTSNFLDLQFNFENLPDALDIGKSLSINEIIKNKKIIFNKEETIKSLKTKVVSSIKSGILNLEEIINIENDIIVNPILINNIENTKLQKLVINEFNEIIDVLNKKNWNTTIDFINGDVQKINLIINTPLKTESKDIIKQTKNKRKN